RCVEGMTLEVLHDGVVAPIVEFAEVTNANDVRARDGIGRAGLLDESIDHLTRVDELVVQHLDGDARTHARMLSEVNGADAALSEDARDEIASDHRADERRVARAPSLRPRRSLAHRGVVEWAHAHDRVCGIAS